MSNDYAALLTTLNVAVFAVGTIQIYTLMKRWTDSQRDTTERTAHARIAVTNALQHNHQPNPEDLRDAYIRPASILRSKSFGAYVAGTLWVAIVLLLGIQQISILRWAGSADKPAAPDLAERSFHMVTIAIAVLLAEGVVRAFSEGVIHQWTVTKPIRQLSRSDRRRMESAVKEYKKTGQLPATTNPSASQSRPGDV
jgi:hypothetical protein